MPELIQEICRFRREARDLLRELCAFEISLQGGAQLAGKSPPLRHVGSHVRRAHKYDCVRCVDYGLIFLEVG